MPSPPPTAALLQPSSNLLNFSGKHFHRWLVLAFFLVAISFVVLNYGTLRLALSKISRVGVLEHAVNFGSSLTSPFKNAVSIADDSHSQHLQPINILLWTQFFSQNWLDHIARNGNSSQVYLDDDVPRSQSRSCFFTMNRTLLEESAAVVFHGRDFNFADMPATRLPWQRYVYYLLESPKHTGFFGNQWLDFNKLGFNWSMTYARDADVFAPYGQIRQQKPIESSTDERREVEIKIADQTDSFWTRKRDAVWLISNCAFVLLFPLISAHNFMSVPKNLRKVPKLLNGTRRSVMVPRLVVQELIRLGRLSPVQQFWSDSKREWITRLLQEHGVTVDTWGGCSGRKPDEILKTVGPKAFFSNYRFYLSFENSLCKDYVTEKAFQGFYYNFLAGPIPVVYGAANYSSYFPRNSYIDAQSFESVADLARYMKELSCPTVNKTELSAFWRWHQTVNPLYEKGYEIDAKTQLYVPDNSKRLIWRTLCSRLWENSTESVIPNMEQKIGECYPPKKRLITDNDDPTKLGNIYRLTLFKK